jgi:hypothetical protein
MIDEQMFGGKQNAPATTAAGDVTAGATARISSAEAGYPISSASFS